MGAALSYYSVFSVAPLLLIVIAVAGLVFGQEAAQGAIVGQLRGLLGDSGAEIVQQMLKSVSEPKEGIVATATGVLSFGLVTAMFALIYRFMPHVRIEWRDVWTGAGVTALLFTVGKFVIGLYLGKSSVASGFGAAGSLAVLLLWVYYSAQIFLLGAEFTWVYAHSLGSRREKPAVQEAASSSVPTAAEPASSQVASAGLVPTANLGSAARRLARAPKRIDDA